METTSLHHGFTTLLDATTHIEDPDYSPAPGEWSAHQVLAHVSLVTAATIAAACSTGSRALMTYDNRLASDTWTLQNLITMVGSFAALTERIRAQGAALCSVADSLSRTELDVAIPTLLISADTLLVDQSVPLRDLLTGLADTELPGHTEQLLALRSALPTPA